MAKKDNFWFGKNVLVTGGDGFVASNLCLELLKQGANVTATIRHFRPFKIMDLLDNGFKDRPDVELSDLSDLDEMRKICDRHQIDTIFHLAASVIVSKAATSPVPTLQNNINSTINILETARIGEIPRVIVASSDKAYGDHAYDKDKEKIPYKEEYALRGLDVYSTSKVCTDMITQAYCLQYKLPAFITRCCNIYGPGDMNFTRLVPRSIMRLLAGQNPVVNEGNLHVYREYCYIDDVVRAYLLLGEKVGEYYSHGVSKKGEEAYGWPAFNVGSYGDGSAADIPKLPNVKNVEQVIKMICEKMEKPYAPKVIPKPENFIEIPDQYNDSSKLIKLGFKCQVGLKEGLDKSVDWYTENQDLFKRIGSAYLK